MKLVLKIILILLILAAILVASRNFILGNLLSSYLESSSGLKLVSRHFAVGISPTYVEIKDLILLNPEGFPEPLMAYIPKLYLEFKPLPIINGKFHLSFLEIDLQEFNVIKTENGRVNLDSLKAIKKSSATAFQQKKDRARLKIDKLQLKIGKVRIKDYSKGPAGEIREFTVNLREEYNNVSNIQIITKIILVKALTKTTISDITNLNLAALRQDVAVVLKGGSRLIGKTVGKFTDTTKKIITGTIDIIEKPFKSEKELKEPSTYQAP